ncbi:MAG: hypothetical protein AB7U35_10495 [Sphingobium sp.]
MASVSENGWTLHYMIGRVLASKVRPGDIVHMPGGRGDLMVLGGRAPRCANDRGSVFVRDPLAETTDDMEMPLHALGMVWISAAGGWSEMPT